MSRELKAVMLAEAGATVGFGHLTRCVALHDALMSLGCQCELVVAGKAPSHVVGTRNSRIQDWRLPKTAVEYVTGVDIAVVDSYVADVGVYEAVAEAASVAVYLDDTARLSYPRGVVVNGSPEAQRIGFRTRQDTTLLLGVRYQLLRAEFEAAAERFIRQNVDRVLVISGGSDAGGIRDGMVASVEIAYPAAVIDVVKAPRSAVEMRDAMLAADVAVSAAGQTLYELAVTGTPAVAVCVADNQVPQALAFERAGAIRLFGAWDESGARERLVAMTAALEPRSAREAMSASARALVDGRGAERVARTCVSRVAGVSSPPPERL